MAEAPVVQFRPSEKQHEVFKAFWDDETTEVLYGGALSGGKSYGLCAFLVYVCLTYPGTTWLLGRSELKNLKATTMVSFWEVCEDWKLKRDSHYTYNEVKGEIEFSNKSKVVLRDLSYMPSDPDCISLNGLLLTGACIDEAGELNKKVKDVILSRVGRWKNDKYGLKPFLLMTCNPTKNFLYEEFYKPSKEGKLLKRRKFIVAKVDDNPFKQKGYKEHISTIYTGRDYQQKVLGNWEYEDHPDNLISYENIINMWGREPQRTGKKYISADVAFRADRLVFMVWDGLVVERIVALEKGDVNKNAKAAEELLRELMRVHKVEERHVVFDADGVGLYLCGYFPSAKPVNNISRPLLGQSFDMLKSQLYFKLAEYINEGKLSFATDAYKQEIIQELEQVRKKDSIEKKLGVVSKDEVKRILGRSPDFSDAMSFRMLFELVRVNNGKYFYHINKE